MSPSKPTFSMDEVKVAHAAAFPRPPMTPYIRIIMEEFNLEHLAAYRVEQTIRDMPGCGTLDHLTRAAIIRLARKAIRTSP